MVQVNLTTTPRNKVIIIHILYWTTQGGVRLISPAGKDAMEIQALGSLALKVPTTDCLTGLGHVPSKCAWKVHPL